MVEKPHPSEVSGSVTAVVVQNAARNVTAMDVAVLRTGERYGKLLVNILMSMDGIVAGRVFLEHSEQMPKG